MSSSLKSVSLADNTPDFEEIAEFYHDTEKSLLHYYSSEVGFSLDAKFIGYSLEEFGKEKVDRLETLDQTCAFALLAALEGAFRTDFHIRCSRKLKDELSRYFRQTFKDKAKFISFEEDILEGWKQSFPEHNKIVGEFKAALKYRHWFAHGRYYVPKLGRRYDFFSINQLALLVERNFQLLLK